MGNRVTIQKFNAETGEKTFEIENENMYFPQMLEELMPNYKSRIYGYFYMLLYNYQRQEAGDLTQMTQLDSEKSVTMDIMRDNIDAILFNRMYLSNNSDEVDINEYGLEKNVVAVATLKNPYAGSSPIRGTLNQAESYFDVRGRQVKFVVDFATNVANVTFQSVSLGSQKDIPTSGTENEPVEAASSFTTIQRMLSVKSEGMKIPKSIFVDSNYHCRFFDSPSAPAGSVLVVRTGGTNEGISYCYLNIVTGVATSWQPLLNHVGSSFGATYNYEDFDVEGGYLYFCRNASTGYGIYRWSLSDLSANAVQLYVFDNTTSSYYWRGGFAVVGSKIYSKGVSSVVDPATGVSYYYHIQIMNLSDPSTIVDRISLYDLFVQINDVSGYIGPAYTLSKANSKIFKDIQNGKLLFSVYSEYSSTWSSSTSQQLQFDKVVVVGIDLTNEEVEFVASPNKLNPLPYHGASGRVTFIDGDIHYIFQSYTDFDFSVRFIPRSKNTRVLLPAPVTKLPTETMKVTYLLTVPEEVLPALEFMQTL